MKIKISLKNWIPYATIIEFIFINTISLQLEAQSVSIDFSFENQIISGFGGMNNPAWIDDLTSDQCNKAFGNEPGQLGFSILRIRIPNYPSQFNREVPTVLHARSLGAKVFATPWSPPASLKSNNNLVGGYLLPENYGAYADHLLNFYSFMQSQGASLHAVSLQNEPDIKVGYESCDWTAQQMIDFLTEQGIRLDSLNIIVAESYNFDRTMTDPILNDPEAESFVDIIGGHIYGEGLYDYPFARERGKEVWMTEHLTGSSDPEVNTWALALDLGNEINECMKANFNAYVWWYIRRFYGPIDDAGNITQKGYVMSQFSKFIRPNALRVDATVASAPNVDATAYKTDTSLVIIVINKNMTDVELTFTLQNGTIDTLTKFTTSASKNLINDGSIEISGNTFNATVDANSITTFTSFAGNAGRYGNLPPVANAGSDIELDDTDGDGSESILLDGTGSIDSDGEIQNYSWSLNGIQIAWEPTYELIADIGKHEIVLTVTDSDGATNSDTATITINSIYSTDLWFEAECGQVGSTWQILSEGDASNEEYVMTPAGTESINAPSGDTTDHIIFSFYLHEAGIYILWGRIITPNANDDSFWLRMDDDNAWVLWNSIPAGNEWHWDDVHDQNNNNQVVKYELDTGYHVLSICFREDGARLDKILLTNTGTIPDGIGDAATNCTDEQPSAIDKIKKEFETISIYPNPAQSEIEVKSNTPFNSLVIITIEGRKLVEEYYSVPVLNKHLSFNLESGMYFIKINNAKSSGIVRFIVK